MTDWGQVQRTITTLLQPLQAGSSRNHLFVVIKMLAATPVVQKKPSGIVERNLPQYASALQLEHLIRQTHTSIMRPFAFFVSWSGVLTLVFRGFSPALATLKDQINSSILSIPKENPGSKWPKVSLGAVRDSKRLTPEQLERINQICREASGALQNPQNPKGQAVLVDKLAVVFYECRCLERQLAKQEIFTSAIMDLAEASSAEWQTVDDVLAEADDSNYWFHASRDGSRESHYRGNALGVTLVHELACFSSQPNAAGYSTALPGILAEFRQKVDAELPGLYTWFSDTSLHMTLRALMG